MKRALSLSEDAQRRRETQRTLSLASKGTFIDEARAFLKSKGYKLGEAKTDLRAGITSYLVTTPQGKTEWWTSKQILKFMGRKR